MWGKPNGGNCSTYSVLESSGDSVSFKEGRGVDRTSDSIFTSVPVAYTYRSTMCLNTSFGIFTIPRKELT